MPPNWRILKFPVLAISSTVSAAGDFIVTRLDQTKLDVEPAVTLNVAVMFPPLVMPFENTSGFVTVPATAGQVIVAEPLVAPKPVMTQPVVLSTPQEYEVAPRLPGIITVDGNERTGVVVPVATAI